MPISEEQLRQWEREKARQSRLAKDDFDPVPTLTQKQRAAAARKEARRKKALVDANLTYYYQPEVFYVLR